MFPIETFHSVIDIIINVSFSRFVKVHAILEEQGP